MDIKSELDATIAPHRILDHPFYRSWSEGTLPLPALASYAAEYGAFIDKVAVGWEACDWPEHADEERYHSELWQQFAGALGTEIGTPTIPQVNVLLDVCDRLFAAADTAWGALYAFEAQQPETAATKLDGLNEHYDMPEEAKTYFEVHADDLYEAEAIVTHLEGASEEERARAVAACSEMSVALWDALTGVYEPFATTRSS